jgi:hypothetical protein
MKLPFLDRIQYDGITRRSRVMWTALLLILLVVVNGCTDAAIGPMAGHWQGEFNGSPTDPKVTMRPEWKFKGYLQLYATGMKFKMHLESQAQIVDATGTWGHKNNKIYLATDKVEFDDSKTGGQLLQKPGLTPIDPTDVRDAISRPLVFSFSDNPQKLEGLKITIGPLLGRFDFTKGQE